MAVILDANKRLREKQNEDEPGPESPCEHPEDSKMLLIVAEVVAFLSKRPRRKEEPQRGLSLLRGMEVKTENSMARDHSLWKRPPHHCPQPWNLIILQLQATINNQLRSNGFLGNYWQLYHSDPKDTHCKVLNPTKKNGAWRVSAVWRSLLLNSSRHIHVHAQYKQSTRLNRWKHLRETGVTWSTCVRLLRGGNSEKVKIWQILTLNRERLSQTIITDKYRGGERAQLLPNIF